MMLTNLTPFGVMINLTQGDTVTLNLLATDDQFNPIDLTGATLQTEMLGPNGIGVVTFPDGQHTLADQSTNPGEFALALSSDDTNSLGQGLHKQIVTQSNVSTAITNFHGNNILTVLPSTPLQ